MSKKTVRINGTDFTDLMAQPYSVRYRRITGQGTDTMSNGSKRVNLLATKAVVTFRVQPISDAAAALLASLCKNATVTLYYYDVATGNYRTIAAIPSEPEFTFAGTNPEGTNLFTVTGLSMEEQ